MFDLLYVVIFESRCKVLANFKFCVVSKPFQGAETDLPLPVNQNFLPHSLVYIQSLTLNKRV